MCFNSFYSLTAVAAMGAFVAANCCKDFNPTINFPRAPAMLVVRRRKDSSVHDEDEQLSLRTLVETRCRSLFTEFRPLWWLPNGHLQTLYCVFGDFSKTDLISYDRKYLRLLDGGTLGLDFTPANSAVLPDDVPIIVVKHGLTGGSYESYVRTILHRACASVEQGGLGYRAVVINFRGCADVPVTTPQLYSAGHTDDLRQALMFISHLYPKASLIGIGFSLGANVMTRYLGEEGVRSRLLAGCALGCPWDLAKNNSGLNNNLVGKHVYSKGMGKNLVNMLKRHVDALVADPDHPVAEAVPLALKLQNPTIERFDDTVTRLIGGSSPPFPFDSAQDYYHWASSHKVLTDIQVPYLAINAADDPVVYHSPEDADGNGYVVLGSTPGGGHLGWFQRGVDGSMERWTTKPVLEWFKAMAEDVVHGDRDSVPESYVDQDGFIKEEGRHSLGCKEIEGVIDRAGKATGIFQGL